MFQHIRVCLAIGAFTFCSIVAAYMCVFACGGVGGGGIRVSIYQNSLSRALSPSLSLDV